jgi:histidinol phosphatase-like PHP family hydrolase
MDTISNSNTLIAPSIDLHIHTNFSDGECCIEKIYEIFKSTKFFVLGVADHYSSTRYLPFRMNKKHLTKYLLSLDRFGLRRGIEADIFEDGSLSIKASEKEMFEYVLAGLHRIYGVSLWDEEWPAWNLKHIAELIRVALIKAIESKIIDVIVHPTWFPKKIKNKIETFISKDWIESLVSAAASNNVAVEISGAWKVPNEEFIKVCLKHGVKIAIGSDAHSEKEVGNLIYPITILKRVNASMDDLFIPKKSPIKIELENCNIKRQPILAGLNTLLKTLNIFKKRSTL